VFNRGRSVTSTTNDPTNLNLSITKRNLSTINQKLPIVLLDDLLPVGIGSNIQSVSSRFVDSEKDKAQNFLSPITKGVVKGAT